MDGNRFDDVARSLAVGVSRRGLIKTLIGGVGGAMLTTLGVGEAAAKKACSKDRDCSGNTPRCEKTSGVCCAQYDGTFNHTCCGPDQVESETSLSSEGTLYQCCPAGSDPKALGSKPGHPRCCAVGTTCRAADKCCRDGEVCANGVAGEKGRCCPAGSSATTCDGKCCPQGGVCAAGDGKKRCCPEASHADLVNGKCCPADHVIATDTERGKAKCCPAGSKPQLVNGACCPAENVAAVGHDNTTVCCPPDASTELCGHACCGADRVCCGSACCDAGQICGENGRCSSCPEGSQSCGTGCCPGNQTCCGGTCCGAGQVCTNGACAASCAGLRETPSADNPCCAGLSANISACDSGGNYCLIPQTGIDENGKCQPPAGSPKCTTGCECVAGPFACVDCVGGYCIYEGGNCTSHLTCTP